MSALVSSDTMYRLLVQGVHDYAIYMLDAAGTVMNWNTGAQRAKGYEASEIVGRNFERFYPEIDRLKGLPALNLASALRDGHFATEGWRIRKDGSMFWASVAIDPVHDESGQFLGFAKITRDRTEQREAERRLLHAANHDPLTGLSNRTAFAAALEDTYPKISQGASFGVLCIDLDRFKPVNDAFGHEVGDEVLKQVAERLDHVVGASGLVARLGGDEFAVLHARAADRVGSTDLAERIVAALKEPFELSAGTVLIGASVGVAHAPDDGTEASDILRHADLASYAAKGSGGHYWRSYDQIMSERASERLVLERKLRHAVAASEFALHYQPIFEASSNGIVGFEALLRWVDGTGRHHSPADFIPIAEDLDLMPRIGAWVLREACRAAREWPDHVVVAVNVSATQLRDAGLLDTVRSILAETGLPGSRLELEITETAVLQNREIASSILRELRGLGILIALDDFGTGFSSLSLVQDLPLTRIKVDRSFIRDIDGTPQSTTVIRAVACLCKGFGLASTAEGVETDYQRDILRQQGCQDLQGFLLGRPQPIEHWDGLLRGSAPPIAAAG